MTLTAETSAPFIFNLKTCELSRGGRIIALCRLHAEIFDAIASAQGPISGPAIARAINTPPSTIHDEVVALACRVKRLGIRIAASPRGRWLVMEDIPRWQPRIPPVVRLAGEA